MAPALRPARSSSSTTSAATNANQYAVPPAQSAPSCVPAAPAGPRPVAQLFASSTTLVRKAAERSVDATWNGPVLHLLLRAATSANLFANAGMLKEGHSCSSRFGKTCVLDRRDREWPVYRVTATVAYMSRKRHQADTRNSGAGGPSYTPARCSNNNARPPLGRPRA